MTLQLDIADPRIQRAIKGLENIDCIPTLAKAHILLVANGTKPAMHTDLVVDLETQHTEPYQVDAGSSAKLVEIITQLGLSYHLQTQEFTRATDRVRVVLTMVFIANDKETVDELLAARAKGDEAREGILLGYPQSSVMAFVHNEMIPIDDVPRFTAEVTPDEMKFLSHRLSKDNWKNEISYLPEYSNIVRQISPKIYSQCISS